MAAKTARMLAGAGLILAVAAVVPAAAIVRDGRLLWALLPVGSAVVAFRLIRREDVAPVWVLSGVSLGFAVLAAWSIGLFFAPSALLLLGAAVSHSVSQRVGWQIVLVPAWCLAGATGLCAVFFVRDQLVVTVNGGRITEAPAIVAGARLFVGVAVVLALVTCVRWLTRRRS